MPLGQTLGLPIGGGMSFRSNRGRRAGERMQVDAVVIFRIGSLGDTVVALPCFHRVARSFPNARRILVTDIPASQKAAPVESVLANSGLIDRVIYFPQPPRGLRDLLNLRNEIRATMAQLVIYVADRSTLSTLRDLCFFRACGIHHVIGAPLGRDLRQPRTDPVSGRTEHEAERLARCLAPLGPIDLNNRDFWDLRLQPSEVRAAEKCLVPLRGRGFVAVSIGGRVASKDWGDGNWAALFALMATRYADLALVFFGSADEFERSGRFAARWPAPVLNLCGRLAPRESAAAMQRAWCFIGHDSGPLHLAAATGVPCIGIFGNYNKPKWWHPMGRGHSIIHDMRGVREIAPQQVHAAIRATLGSIAGQTSQTALWSADRSRFTHAEAFTTD